MPRARPSPEPVGPHDPLESSAARWSVVLRALREAAGATQAGWAARLGFGRSTLQRWERGEAPPSPDAEAALLEVCDAARPVSDVLSGAVARRDGEPGS